MFIIYYILINILFNYIEMKDLTNDFHDAIEKF